LDNEIFEILSKLIKWIQENPYPPLYLPSKTTNLFKKKSVNYSNITINQTQYQEFVQKNQERSDERMIKLTNIIKSKLFG
jgi:hypothetical protein